MALTKYQSPQVYTPAYNEQVFLYISDELIQPDFKYKIKVYVNTIEYDYDILPNPDGFMLFDAKETVKNYISTYFNTESNLYKCESETADVTVEVYEYYSGTTQDDDTVDYTVFNACLLNKEFNNYVSTDYYKPTIGDYTDAKLFMNELFSEVNVDRFVTLNTHYWLTFIKGLADNITYSITDEVGSPVGSGTITLPTSTDTDIIRVNLSAEYIGGLASVTILNGYTIECALNDGVDTLADIFIPTINSICSKHNVYRLYFLKRGGSVGYCTFPKSSTKREIKKTNSVKLNPKTIYANGGGYSYGARNDQHYKNITSTDLSYEMTLNTDWITQSQSVKLSELFDSPKVWMQDDLDGSITTVSVIDNSFEFKKHANEPLFNYTVNVSFDCDETRQRGI